MCSISKYPRHFLQLSFLALIFSQYSCELSNLLQISDAMITSKIMSLYLLSRMSLLGSLSYINLRQILSVSFTTWWMWTFSILYFLKISNTFLYGKETVSASRIWRTLTIALQTLIFFQTKTRFYGILAFTLFYGKWFNWGCFLAVEF